MFVGALVLAWALATILVLCTVLMFVPGPTGALWLLGTVATEQALVITVGAVVLALLLRRRVMFVVIGAVVAVASLIPTVTSASAAHSVEWREYLAGTSLTASEGPDVTEAFAAASSSTSHRGRTNSVTPTGWRYRIRSISQHPVTGCGDLRPCCHAS